MAKEQKKQLRKEWNSVSENDNDTNKLKIISLPAFNSQLNKKTNTIPLLEKYDIATASSIVVERTFTDFPEWAISSSKLVSVFYSENGLTIGTIPLPGVPSDPFNPPLESFTFKAQDIWKKLDDDYLLRVEVNGSFRQGTVWYDLKTMPLYVDLSLVIFNERVFHEIQHNKT